MNPNSTFTRLLFGRFSVKTIIRNAALPAGSGRAGRDEARPQAVRRGGEFEEAIAVLTAIAASSARGGSQDQLRRKRRATRLRSRTAPRLETAGWRGRRKRANLPAPARHNLKSCGLEIPPGRAEAGRFLHRPGFAGGVETRATPDFRIRPAVVRWCCAGGRGSPVRIDPQASRRRWRSTPALRGSFHRGERIPAVVLLDQIKTR